MLESTPRSKIDNILFQVMMTFYHSERVVQDQFGVDYQQIYALQYLLRHPNGCVTDIADELAIPLFHASRLIRRLSEQDLVIKLQSEHDRRNTLINLTPAGTEMVKKIEERSYRMLLENTQGLTEDEIKAFFTVAEDLHKVLGVTQQVLRSKASE
ncbi:MAG TPA: MarR family winged helix-turn-helix transcriptional regulator [Longilinea sp.]|jgi:DNA-binding MarR family transcriptional regulator|nr:MarR family winged helix-turn-helix transcriptional regulator [Longilinea sp.]